MLTKFQVDRATYNWDPNLLAFVRADRLTKMPKGIIPVRRGVWESGSKQKLTDFERKMYPAVKDLTPGPGGSYVVGAFSGDPQDVTGKTFGGGIISTSTGRNRFDTGDTEMDPAPKSFGRQVKINLVKPHLWSWHEGGDNHRQVQHLISHESGGQHYYSVDSETADDHPITLASYPNQPSEPRLRPTTRGDIHVGKQIGSVKLKGGKVNPVYDKIWIRKRGWMPEDAQPR